MARSTAAQGTLRLVAYHQGREVEVSLPPEDWYQPEGESNVVAVRSAAIKRLAVQFGLAIPKPEPAWPAAVYYADGPYFAFVCDNGEIAVLGSVGSKFPCRKHNWQHTLWPRMKWMPPGSGRGATAGRLADSTGACASRSGYAVSSRYPSRPQGLPGSRSLHR